MPAPGHFIAPIPSRWLEVVIPLLDEGDSKKVRWTFTAQNELYSLGLNNKAEAYDHCLTTLRTRGICGENIPDMRDSFDETLCETWAFLCPHPLKVPTPLYAKIGLHDSHLSLNFFSLHIDRKGDLATAIANYQKERK